MVHSKAVILAAVLSTTVGAVAFNGGTDQVTQADEANLIEAREPMLPPPGGFKFRWGGNYRPQILAGLRRDTGEVDANDGALSRRMFIPPGGPIRAQRWGPATGVINQKREPGEYQEQELEAREPMIGNGLGNMPPVGWMSPWWNGKPVGSGSPFRKPGQKRGEDEDVIEAREPMPPRPFGYRYTNTDRLHILPIRPAPVISRDLNYNYEGLEARGRSNGRYDTTKGPLPAYIPPYVRELIETRGMRLDNLRGGPPMGWASPWWNGKPVGMARSVYEDQEARSLRTDNARDGLPIGWGYVTPAGIGREVHEELEAREPIMMNFDAPRPPTGWKSPWFHGRPVGALRLRDVNDEELETRGYDMDELD